ILFFSFFFSSRRRHTRWPRDWSSDVCSSDLPSWTSSPRRDIDPVPSRVLHPMTIRRGDEVQLGDDLARADRIEDGPPLRLVRRRSEERRVGKEWRCRWSLNHYI